MKTAFIYDKWYSALGGGEVVASNLALCLHQLGYQTTIISSWPVTLDRIKSIQGLDLSSINFVESFNDQLRLDQLTQNSDIFINCSFWDLSTGRSKKNYYYCFFPSPPRLNILKKTLSNLLHPYEKTPDNRYIFYNLLPTKTYTLKFSLTLPEFSYTNLKKYRIFLNNATILKSTVTIDHFHNQVNYFFQYQPLTNSVWFDSQLPVNIYRYPFQDRLFSFLRSGIFDNVTQVLSKFDRIFATSAYTQKWITKLWNTQSTIVYPPVPLISKKPKSKKNQICSIGRFTTKGNHKKHQIMIQAFKQMIDDGLSGWELHLAGGLGSEPSSQQYTKILQQQISNYPIFLHFSPSRTFLEQMLLDSKIYWHSAGHGTNPNHHPEQFEHFGITPVEGLSAGCLPVVFEGGGLPEIISVAGLDYDKHTFNTIEELVNRTNYLINNNINLPKNIHQILSSNFSVDQFQKNLETELSK
jgi:glycosyltransferase involved in cell wall biosynthesis